MYSSTTKDKNGFNALNGTQFLGAFNDNIFKLLVTICLVAKYGKSATDQAMFWGGVCFVTPFLLFSVPAGMLTDRVSKRKLAIASKVLELVAMLVGAMALHIRHDALLYATLALMATQSTLFAPAKMGLIPELVKPEKLSDANGKVHGATYIAVLLGLVAAPLLSERSGDALGLAGLVCVLVAVFGILTSLMIPPSHAAAPGRRSFRQDLKTATELLRQDRKLRTAVFGSAFFSFIGSIVQLNVLGYGINAMGMDKEQASAVFLFAAAGIGIGGYLAGKISGRGIELGLVPCGLGLMTTASLLLGWLPPALPTAGPLLFAVGAGSSLFVVPLKAWMLWRTPENRRGRLLAVSNQLGWIAVLLGTLVFGLFASILTLGAVSRFGATGLLCLTATAASVILLRSATIRFVLRIACRFTYKTRLHGIESVPTTGGALLLPNHTSFADVGVLIGNIRRPIRFVGHRSRVKNGWLKPFADMADVIPIDAKSGPKAITQALKEARDALLNGELVCIFPEGGITRTGAMQTFRAGFERVAQGTKVPLIPIHIHGLWGGRLSHAPNPEKGLRRRPLEIAFGRPLHCHATAPEAEASVHALETENHQHAASRHGGLPHKLIGTARRMWRHKIVHDSTGRALSYGGLMVAAQLIAEHLTKQAPDETNCAVLLPPSAAGVVANLGVTLSQRAAVNLNPTAGKSAISFAIKQADLHTCITTRKLLDRVQDVPLPGRVLLIEDMLTPATQFKKAIAYIKMRFAPRPSRLQSTRTAAIMFSSGTTGTPKGICLTHANILANVAGMHDLFRTDKQHDRLSSALPLFHAFGYSATLWMPVLTGTPVYYHPSPLDTRGVLKAIRKAKPTLLFSTPTFLQSYARRARPEAFESVEHIMLGAEKMTQAFAERFHATFNIMPLQGYGATELAPVACVNVPDRQGHRGNKPGSVGKPLPGVQVRAVNTETGEALGCKEVGMIQVKGPNVMKGYLKAPSRTAEVITADGWYITGDLGALDEEGFLRIEGRLARFSKIGGEMVPHEAVEDRMQATLPTQDRCLAVVSTAHPRKGEQLVVFHTAQANKADLLSGLQALPGLWRPSPNAFYHLDEIPTLATGKLDLGTLKRLARPQ